MALDWEAGVIKWKFVVCRCCSVGSWIFKIWKRWWNILRPYLNKGVMVIVEKGKVMTVMDEDEVVRFYNKCL